MLLKLKYDSVSNFTQIMCNLTTARIYIALIYAVLYINEQYLNKA